MTMSAPSQRRVVSAADADALVGEVIAALDAIGAALAEETRLMSAGRINEALALVDRKQERAGAYMRLLESVKANAVALARHAPVGVERMKARHAAFSEGLRLNQAVIATVKSVSESLVRGVQQEMNAGKRLSVYGPGLGSRLAQAAAPLALSVKL